VKGLDETLASWVRVLAANSRKEKKNVERKVGRRNMAFLGNVWERGRGKKAVVVPAT